MSIRRHREDRALLKNNRVVERSQERDVEGQIYQRYLKKKESNRIAFDVQWG